MNHSIIEGCIRQSLDLPIKKKIAILDLDGTLWNFHSGYTTFKTVDQLQELIYPEVFDCLKLLADRSIPIAIASASPRKDYCMKYFDMAFSEFKRKFKFIHIECCSKQKHFKLIKKAFDCEYEDMYFFDDQRNFLHEAHNLGINAFSAQGGLTVDTINLSKILDLKNN